MDLVNVSKNLKYYFFMAGNGLNIIRKYMINYFPKSKMAAKSVRQ